MNGPEKTFASAQEEVDWLRSNIGKLHKCLGLPENHDADKLGLMYASPSDEIEALESYLRDFLAYHGNVGECRGCGMRIYWLTHANGKKAPYTARGLNHFADCSNRQLFLKEKKHEVRH